MREFDVNTDKTVGPEKILVNKGVHPEDKPIWIEGPHMYKINGKYFLMSAEGGTSDMHSEVIFRSDSPFGPFVPAKKNPILTQRDLDPNRIDLLHVQVMPTSCRLLPATGGLCSLHAVLVRASLRILDVRHSSCL